MSTEKIKKFRNLVMWFTFIFSFFVLCGCANYSYNYQKAYIIGNDNIFKEYDIKNYNLNYINGIVELTLTDNSNVQTHMKNVIMVGENTTNNCFKCYILYFIIFKDRAHHFTHYIIYLNLYFDEIFTFLFII